MRGPIEQTTAWKGACVLRTCIDRPFPCLLRPLTSPPHHYDDNTTALESHAERVKRVHLRDLLQDAARNSALAASAGGILFDYSRQNATVEVRCARFYLFSCSFLGLEGRWITAGMIPGISRGAFPDRETYTRIHNPCRLDRRWTC